MFAPILPKAILKSPEPDPSLWKEHWFARKLNKWDDINCELCVNFELSFYFV